MSNHTLPTDELQGTHEQAHEFESVKSILPRALSHLFVREELPRPCSALVSA